MRHRGQTRSQHCLCWNRLRWQYARSPIRHPRPAEGSVFALTAILTLALCIGANTAIYTVVDRVLLRPLAYPRPDRLAMVVRHYRAPAQRRRRLPSGVAWVALPERDDGARPGGVRMVWASIWSPADKPNTCMQQRVSAGYFKVSASCPLSARVQRR